MPAPQKSPRPLSRDEASAVRRGNRAAKRRAYEEAMDDEAKKPITMKASGGRMKPKKTTSKRTSPKPTAERQKKRSRFEPMGTKSLVKPKTKKMAMGGKCRGMGAATKGGNYSRG